MDLKISRDNFYIEIQERIAALSVSDRDHLKELTDWVEAFELGASAGEAPGLSSERRTSPGGARRGDGTSTGYGVQPHGELG